MITKDSAEFESCDRLRRDRAREINDYGKCVSRCGILREREDCHYTANRGQ